MRLYAAAIGIATLLAAHAGAQTRHPNVVTFRPSLDHNAMDAGGQPLVLRYELEIYRAGSAAHLVTIDLGKPEPDPDGYIRAAIETEINTPALAELTLEGRVAAVGALGTSRSGASNVFVADACRYLTPGSIEVAGHGGVVHASVAASGQCTWRVAATGFLTPQAAAGVGDSRLGVTADANPAASGRVGGVSVGPHLILIFQPPAP